MKVDEKLAETLIEMLMNLGYKKMPLETKNLLVTYLAESNGLSLTDVTLDYIFNFMKSLKIKELSGTCRNNILDGFVSSNGHTYRTNSDDQINMIGMKDLLDSDPTMDIIPWKTEDVGYVMHTREEWLHEVYYLGLQFKRNQLFRYDLLKNLVINAETEEDILRINWDMPYPPVEQSPVEDEVVEDETVEDKKKDVIEDKEDVKNEVEGE